MKRTGQVMEATRLAYREIKPEIGAEVLADKQALLSGAHATDIRDLLERRGVLVFPRVDFSARELIDFTRTPFDAHSRRREHLGQGGARRDRRRCGNDDRRHRARPANRAQFELASERRQSARRDVLGSYVVSHAAVDRASARNILRAAQPA